MPNRTRHSSVVVTADDGSSEVGTNEWNDDHVGMPDRSVNVLDYGAVANGVTNDTTAIHSARDVSDAKTIVFPPGTYLVSTLNANVAGQTWHLCAGAKLSLAAGTNNHVFSVSAADITIEGEGWTSIIDQNSGSQSAGNGINVDSAARCTVRNIRIEDCYTDGIEVINAAPFFEADHVQVDGFGQYGGIVVNGNGGCDDAYIHDCHIKNGPSSGDADSIGIHGNASGGTVHRCRVQDNYIEVNGADMFAIEIGPFSGVDPVEGAIVTGNQIKATGDCFGGISMDNCAMGVVANNVYDHNSQSGTNGIGGIELPGADEMEVVGNIVVADGAIRPLTVDRASRCNITGNIIKGWKDGSRLGGIQITTSVAGEHCNDNVISGNTFIHPSGVTSPGVMVQCNNASAEIKRNIISNNMFVGASVSGSYGIAMYQDGGTIDYALVTGNIFSNLTNGVSEVGANSSVSNNLFENVTTP